ncbi:hypothetical protein G647_09661 [Cladophialophora carrionii CBS 160.54]|uniref:Uncharacterized protein n=1 Tax=Cladophialophora carrionii CBS 160.54 TaxID=1279043 RepID=V9DLE5_9EURO|nr:uncharacterized protein G647_09661 [Cladophialophora carrionii CBS 160.54]ETI27471.1 hypothetical protein G647_09661 [Cladophialophora carrionii CBS 160.54]
MPTAHSNTLSVYALGSNSSCQLGVGHAEDVSSVPQRCIFAVEAEIDDETEAEAGVGLEVSDDQEARRGGGGGESPSQATQRRGQDLDPSEIGDIRKIVAGGNHTVVLTDRGRVFIAGRGAGGLRGVGGEADDDIFREVTKGILEFCAREGDGDGECDGECDGEAITDVAASWDVSFAVVGGRVVVCWGNFGGSCSVSATASCITPAATTSSTTSATGAQQMWTAFVTNYTDVKDKVTITAIEAGMAHVVVLLSNGQVYGWGASRKGQLGEQYQREKILRDARRLDVGSDGRRLLPFAPERVILGREYTVFLRRGEKLVIWGSMSGNRDAEWLFGQDDMAVSGWSSVHVLSPSGGSSSAVVKSMGKNNHGQFAPANLPAVCTMAAGSEHCVALTVEGQVIAWGWGEHGNCGEQVDGKGNVVDRWNVIPLPQLDQGTVVRDVAAGCATTFVICGADER